MKSIRKKLVERVLTVIALASTAGVLIALVSAIFNRESAWWTTPDQSGQHFFTNGKFELAARSFEDPMRQGVAWFRANEFKKAAQTFERLSTAEARYNRGNCLIMLGKYQQAIESFDEALLMRPDWEAAKTNRELAIARAEVFERNGGDMGDQKIGADEVVFDKNKQNEGQQTDVEDDGSVSDDALQAMWLKRVQTNPADFLRSKFAYQLSFGQNKETQ